MLKNTLILASCAMLLITVTALVHAASSNPSAPASTPVQAVVTPYIQIHDALAKDSLDGVSSEAALLAKAAKDDRMFPVELSEEAQTLAQATDLASARAAFKPMSETLIKALTDNKALPAEYSEAYCPMEKAHWLQTGTTVANPFGASMLHCGSIINASAASMATPSPMAGGCCN